MLAYSKRNRHDFHQFKLKLPLYFKNGSISLFDRSILEVFSQENLRYHLKGFLQQARPEHQEVNYQELYLNLQFKIPPYQLRQSILLPVGL